MINGANVVEFLIVFGGGFMIGCFFGIFMISLMHASSLDSRAREQMEEQEEKDHE